MNEASSANEHAHGVILNAAPQPAAPRPWYVCLTKPRQEAYAVLKLNEQGYETYVPTLDSWSRRAGQWCRKQAVMFPRYAFVRPRDATHSLAPVRNTPGVSALVKFGPVLASMPDEQLSALRALLAARAAAQPGQPLQSGQQVVFVAGPLKGLAGIVSSSASERVNVLLTLLGQTQTVSVPTNDLAAA